MNKFTKAIAAIMLMMVVAVGCNNSKTSKNTENNNSFYDSILGLPSGTCALELPATDAVEWKQYEWLCKDVYLVRSKNQIEPTGLIVVDGKILDVSSFKEVVPKNVDVDIQDYPFLSMHSLRMPARFMGDSIYQKRYDGARDFSNQINVSQISSETYSINGVSVKGVDCRPMLKQLMQQDPDYVIRFNVDEEMLYGDYMVIVTSAMEALDELKEEYAMDKYSKHWDEVYEYEEQIDILDHFPFRFF